MASSQMPYLDFKVRNGARLIARRNYTLEG